MASALRSKKTRRDERRGRNRPDEVCDAGQPRKLGSRIRCRTAIVRVNLNLDRAAPAQDGPSATTNGFGLAARLLCALVVALANRIPKWACEHRGPVGCVLRNMRRDVEVAQIVHELAFDGSHCRAELGLDHQPMSVLVSALPR